MPNMRVIHDNAADRADVVASSTAGQLVASNMQNDTKGLVHRSTSRSVTYTLTWSADEVVAGVGLPATNLSPDAQVRVRAYSASGQLQADSGLVYACPGAPLELWDWTQPLNANAFAYGGATKCAVWLDDHYVARQLVIDIVDPQTAAGYIDCARLVVGGYWAPERNASYGLLAELVDMTESARTESGDLRSERAPVYDTMDLDLSFLDDCDRARVMQIMRGTAGGRLALVSIFPDDNDSLLEQDHIIYGRLAGGGVTASMPRLFAKKFTIQGW